jgi:hypothetical protein
MRMLMPRLCCSLIELASPWSLGEFEAFSGPKAPTNKAFFGVSMIN